MQQLLMLKANQQTFYKPKPVNHKLQTSGLKGKYGVRQATNLDKSQHRWQTNSNSSPSDLQDKASGADVLQL